MTGNNPAKNYPRLHVELRHLSDTTVLVDGWLIENERGKGRTVLRYTGNITDAREQVSHCASRYDAQCGDQDIVVHR
jgi:hypothetical protein